MNVPGSRQKWLAIMLAAVMMVTAGTTMAAPDSSATAEESGNSATATPSAQNKAGDAKAEPLTLEQAVEKALASNSQLQKLRLDVDTADVNARLAYAQGKDLDDDYVTTLSAAQQKYVTSAKAEMAKKVNAQYLKATESQIKLAAQKAYYDLLDAQADLALKEQSLKRAQTQLKVAKAAFDVGTRAKTDVLQAEAGVAGAQAALAAAQTNLEVARLKLNELIGEELNKNWTLTSKQDEIKKSELTLGEATELALKQRAEVVQKQEEIKVAELDVELIDKYLSLSTYQGQMARNNVEKAKLALEETKRSITVEVAEAYYRLQSAESAIEAYKKAQEAAAEGYRLTNLRFENGLATTLEVIQAEEELSERENQYRQALHNYNLAVVSFENAIGN